MRTIIPLLFLLSTPGLAAAELIQGTIVKLDTKNSRLVIKTEEGDKTLAIGRETLGLEHAIEGAAVRIEYIKQGDTLKASEINPTKPDLKG